MGELSPLLIAACVFGLVCVGVLLVAGFLLVRTAGFGIVPSLLESLSGGRDEDTVDDDRPSRVTRRSVSVADLRAKAQSLDLDFDRAVQQYREQPNDPVVPPNATPPTPQVNNPDPGQGKSRFGVRYADDSPNRMLRDRRLPRNAAGGSQIPRNDEEDLLGGLGALDEEDMD